MAKKSNKKKSNGNDELGKALRSSGALLPETEDEVKAFYEIYGNTKLDLPAELQNSDFLFVEKEAKVIPMNPFNEEEMEVSQLAYAAREGQEDLPDHIANKMKDLKKQKRGKKKNSGKKK